MVHYRIRTFTIRTETVQPYRSSVTLHAIQTRPELFFFSIYIYPNIRFYYLTYTTAITAEDIGRRAGKVCQREYNREALRFPDLLLKRRDFFFFIIIGHGSVYSTAFVLTLIKKKKMHSTVCNFGNIKYTRIWRR